MDITISLLLVAKTIAWLCLTGIIGFALVLRHFDHDKYFTWLDAVILATASALVFATTFDYLHWHITW